MKSLGMVLSLLVPPLTRLSGNSTIQVLLLFIRSDPMM